MSVRSVVVATVVLALVPCVAAAAPPTRNRIKPEKPVVQKTAPVIHEVKRGETLGAIAKHYEVTVSSLLIANRLRGGPRGALSIGQRLTIPRRPGPAPMLRARRGTAAFEPLPVSLVLSVPGFEEGAPRFVWPVTGPVNSTFGRRSRSWHRGIDIGAERGVPIVASAAGVVVASGFEARYGQRVMIEHEGGFVTVYAHNERNLVDVGQEVSRGQVIAIVGRTGHASGEHVHFEIRYDGRVYNPLYLLPLPPRPVQVDLVAASSEDDE